MKRALVLIFLLLLYSQACHVITKSNKMENENCFSPENFLKIKEYIVFRLGVSGMGKFYVEYPPDKNQPKDGMMKPSNHPENVFDIRYDEMINQIVFDNEAFEFNFHSKLGFVYKKNQTSKEHRLANDIFCYLLNEASLSKTHRIIK